MYSSVCILHCKSNQTWGVHFLYFLFFRGVHLVYFFVHFVYISLKQFHTSSHAHRCTSDCQHSNCAPLFCRYPMWVRLLLKTPEAPSGVAAPLYTASYFCISMICPSCISYVQLTHRHKLSCRWWSHLHTCTSVHRTPVLQISYVGAFAIENTGGAKWGRSPIVYPVIYMIYILYRSYVHPVFHMSN